MGCVRTGGSGRSSSVAARGLPGGIVLSRVLAPGPDGLTVSAPWVAIPGRRPSPTLGGRRGGGPSGPVGGGAELAGVHTCRRTPSLLGQRGRRRRWVSMATWTWAIGRSGAVVSPVGPWHGATRLTPSTAAPLGLAWRPGTGTAGEVLRTVRRIFYGPEMTYSGLGEYRPGAASWGCAQRWAGTWVPGRDPGQVGRSPVLGRRCDIGQRACGECGPARQERDHDVPNPGPLIPAG